MSIVAQERDLLLSFTSFLAALGIAILLHSTIRGAATFLSTYTHIRTHRYTHAVLLLLSTTLLLLALPTGLAPHIAVTAAALAALAAPPHRSATFVLCVAVMTLAVPRWISTVQLEIPPSQQTWVSWYYGQTALWPAESPTYTRYLLIVHNDVRILRCDCEDHVPSTRRWRDVETDAVLAGHMGVNHTRVLVSLGDQTSIYALESCGDSFSGNSPLMHQITLLGANSTLRDLTIRCRLPLPQSDTSRAAPRACLNLISDVVLLNVHIQLYKISGEFFSSHNIHQANGCTDALEQLRGFNAVHGINVESFLTCIPKLGVYDILQHVDDQRLVPSLLKKEIPTSLRWVWRAPGIVQSIFERVNYILEHVILPASTLTIAKLSDLFTVLKFFSVYAVERLTPYVHSMLGNTQMLVYGISCASTKSIHKSFCRLHDVYSEINWWYLLGVQMVHVSSNVFHLALDTVDFIPGFLTACSFAWRLEWSLTLLCMQTTRFVIVKLCVEVIVPLSQLLSLTLGRVVYAVLRLAPFCYDVIGITTITKGIGKLVVFVWYAEMQWLAGEWVIVRKLCWYAGTCFLTVLSLGFGVLGVCCTWGLCILRLYTRASVASHIFVALLQTVFIFIAMRNELRDIATREFGRYPSFMSRYSGGIVLVMIITFARVHSVATIRYLLAHVAVLFMLVGLSVLRIFSKVYNMTLYVIFPCVSSYVCLEFVSKQPKRSGVMAMSMAKGLLVILVDGTIGNFVSLFLRELFYFILFVLLLLVLLGAWEKQLYARLTTVYRQCLLVLMPPADPMPLQTVES